MKLNLGCGEFKKEGYLNVDVNPAVNPDLQYDLNQLPYPFPDNYFDIIEADHVLEHLANPFASMREFHRILKDNGRLKLKVPHFSRGFTHPDHKRGFDVTFPYYFNPLFKGGYAGVEFSSYRVRMAWISQTHLKSTILPPIVYHISYLAGKLIDLIANLSVFACSRGWCFWVGGFEEIAFEFICKKNA